VKVYHIYREQRHFVWLNYCEMIQGSVSLNSIVILSSVSTRIFPYINLVLVEVLTHMGY